VSPKQDQGQRNQFGAIDNGVKKTKKINKGPINLIEYECRCTERRGKTSWGGEVRCEKREGLLLSCCKGGGTRPVCDINEIYTSTYQGWN
jgi:hypothetical protein